MENLETKTEKVSCLCCAYSLSKIRFLVGDTNPDYGCTSECFSKNPYTGAVDHRESSHSRDENKNGDCKYYKFSLGKTILNFLLSND